MTTLLLIIFILQCTLSFVFFYKKGDGVFQFPFLLACVNLTFILPQVIAIFTTAQRESSFLDLTLTTMVICNLCASIGFNYGEKRGEICHSKTVYEGGLPFIILLFFIVGSVAYYLNRGVYRGGFVEGEYVIINFFTSYVLYSLVLAFVGKKNGVIHNPFYYFVLISVCLIFLDRIVLTGRRSDTVRIVLIIAFFISYNSHARSRNRFIKLLIPFFFVLGMFANTQVVDYRVNAYKDISFWDNLRSLDFSTSKNLLDGLSEGEVFLCAKGINYCAEIDGYNYGAYDWNRIIHDFVPSIIVGRRNKEALMIPIKTNDFTGALTASGATLTGYFDSFASFGLLGGIKFLLIGLLMGFLWGKKDHSDTALIMYLCLLTNSLNIVTHSTSYFTSGLVFFMFFVYTILKLVRRRLIIDRD